MTRKGKYLRRYTDVAALLYLLKEKRITLLDPQSWDDRNDSYYLDLYKKKKRLKSILALCFTMASERYHFWRVFGSGSSGVRIRFRREELLRAVVRPPDLWGKEVDYLQLDKIETTELRLSEFPFVKRHAFKDEKEFRLIYESRSRQVPKLDVPIPLSCIDHIVLSPWLHPDLSSRVKGVLLSIEGCNSLKISQSKLIDNRRWKSAGEKAIRTAK